MSNLLESHNTLLAKCCCLEIPPQPTVSNLPSLNFLKRTPKQGIGSPCPATWNQRVPLNRKVVRDPSVRTSNRSTWTGGLLLFFFLRGKTKKANSLRLQFGDLPVRSQDQIRKVLCDPDPSVMGASLHVLCEAGESFSHLLSLELPSQK